MPACFGDCQAVELLLVSASEVDRNPLDAGRDDKIFRPDLTRDDRRGKILVDHGFDPDQVAVGVARHRNAAAAARDQKLAFTRQPADQIDLDNAARNRRRNYAPKSLPGGST